MELSPICKKEYPGAAGAVSQRVPGSGAYAPLPLLRPGKQGASGDFGTAYRRRFCRADDRQLCPRLRPAQLLCRGAGLPLYGTWLPALPALQQRYPNRQVVLEVEPPDHTAPNARQRQRRLDFYAKNGFLPCNLPVRLCGVALDVLTPGGQALDFAAYQGFYRPIFGRLAPLFVQKRQ